MDEHKGSASSEAQALARFVAESRASRTRAWACVERLKAACAAEFHPQGDVRVMRARTAWLVAESQALRAESQTLKAESRVVLAKLQAACERGAPAAQSPTSAGARHLRAVPRCPTKAA